VKDFLILGPDPSHGRGRSFEDQAEHEGVLGKVRVEAKKNSRLRRGIRIGHEGNGCSIRAEVEAGTASADEADFKGSVLELEFGKNGDSSGVIRHP
jgi:hypothetical protein